jgi:hypothetical protein
MPRSGSSTTSSGANWQAYQQAGAAPAARGSVRARWAVRRLRRLRAAAGPGGNVRYEFRTAGTGDAGEFSDFFRTFFSGGRTPAGRASPGRRSRPRAEPASRTSSRAWASSDGGAGNGRRGVRRRTRGGPAPPPRRSRDHARGGLPRHDPPDRGRRQALEVTIPRGVTPAAAIRLTGKAPGGRRPRRRDPRPSAPRLHPPRRGPRARAAAHAPEALLGAEVPVTTLKGRVLLTIPAGTQQGRTFRLTGQGMPRLKGDRAAATCSSRSGRPADRSDRRGEGGRARPSSTSSTSPTRAQRVGHLTMQLDRFTQKAQEAIVAAQSPPRRLQSPVLDAEHLLAALVEPDDGVPAETLRRLGVDLPAFRGELAGLSPARPDPGRPAHARPAREAVVERAEEEAGGSATSTSRPSTCCSASPRSAARGSAPGAHGAGASA